MNPRASFSTSDDIKRFRINVEQYHRMGEAGAFDKHPKVQLIDGEIIEMAPVGALHFSLTDKLFRFFAKTVDSNYAVRMQGPIVLSDESEPEPDIVIALAGAKGYADRHPNASECVLVIEVAHTTLHIDRNIKAPLYAQHGIPEYWIVDAERRVIEQYTWPEDGKYRNLRTYDADEACAPNALPNCAVSLRSLIGS